MFTLSISSSLSIFNTFTSLFILLINPDNTLPGPISTNVLISSYHVIAMVFIRLTDQKMNNSFIHDGITPWNHVTI